MIMKSRVAGILEKNGGIRVVVSNGCLNCHLFERERLFVLPGFVDEPVPWDQISDLIDMVVRYVGRERWRKFF